MIGTATHYGLNVSDLDEALSFYRDTLGLVEERRFEMSDVQSDIVGVDGVEGEIVFLDAGGFEVELICYEEPANGSVWETADNHDVGVPHLCLQVDDVEAVYDRLRDEITFVSEPKRVADGLGIVYCYDPDGNVVEFQEPVE